MDEDGPLSMEEGQAGTVSGHAGSLSRGRAGDESGLKIEERPMRVQMAGDHGRIPKAGAGAAATGTPQGSATRCDGSLVPGLGVSGRTGFRAGRGGSTGSGTGSDEGYWLRDWE